MFRDPEIQALNNVYEALCGLQRSQVNRVIAWIANKFGLDDKPGNEAVSTGPTVSSEPAWSEVVQPTGEPVKKRRGRIAKKTSPDLENQEPKFKSNGFKDFMKFGSLKEVFQVTQLKSVSAKILVAAAFLQESMSFKDMSSYDITSRLKEIDIPIKNASLAVKSMITRKPSLLMQIGTLSDSKQARRKFCVTKEGLIKARKYLNQ